MQEQRSVISRNLEWEEEISTKRQKRTFLFDRKTVVTQKFSIGQKFGSPNLCAVQESDVYLHCGDC